MFFVVTTGRSGSKTIARVLSESPNCICLHEPEPKLVKEATLYQYGLLSDEWMKALLLSTRSPTVGGRVYGESNQKLSGLIPVLAEAFPLSQFIWLVRDGRDVVASSYYARQWYKPVGEYVAQRQRRGPSRTVKEWFWYRLRGDLAGDMSTAGWEAMSRFEKNCWLWSKTNETIKEHLAKLPEEKWMLVRLADLFEQLPEICRFVSVQPPPDVEEARYNASVGRSPSETRSKPWTEWSGDQKTAFETWCQDMMDWLFPEWRDENGQWLRTYEASSLPPIKRPVWHERLRLRLTNLAQRVFKSAPT